jgi:hypothetical protein
MKTRLDALAEQLVREHLVNAGYAQERRLRELLAEFEAKAADEAKQAVAAVGGAIGEAVENENAVR